MHACVWVHVGACVCVCLCVHLWHILQMCVWGGGTDGVVYCVRVYVAYVCKRGFVRGYLCYVSVNDCAGGLVGLGMDVGVDVCGCRCACRWRCGRGCVGARVCVCMRTRVLACACVFVLCVSSCSLLSACVCVCACVRACVCLCVSVSVCTIMSVQMGGYECVCLSIFLYVHLGHVCYCADGWCVCVGVLCIMSGCVVYKCMRCMCE